MYWRGVKKRANFILSLCTVHVLKIVCVFICLYIIYNYWYISEVSLTSEILNCNNCFKQDWDLLLNNKNICKTVEHGEGTWIRPSIIIFIPSSPSNFKSRNIVRRTWMSASKHNTGAIRYVFILGLSSDDTINANVRGEFWKEKDITVFSFLDTYRNLTYKSVMGYKWATQFCSDVEFVMKADDDIYLNIPGLLKTLSEAGSLLSDRVGGICNANAMRMRDNSSKWHVSTSEYPFDRYPKYVKGPGYLTKMIMAKEIVNISKNIPYFYLEDVYIGFALKKLGKECVFLYGFFQEKDIKHTVCNLKHPDFVLIHNVGEERTLTIWKEPCLTNFKAPIFVLYNILFRIYHNVKVIIGSLF